MKRLLGLALIFALIGCSKDSKNANQNSPEAVHARFEKLQDVKANIDISALEENPYVIEREGEKINVPLGYGLPEDYKGEADKVSEKTCVNGKMIISNRLESIGGFGGLLRSEQEVFQSANPFYQFDEFRNNTNKQLAEFVQKAYEGSTNSASSAVKWRQHNFDLQLDERKKIAGRECKSASNESAKEFIAGVSMEIGLTLIRKVRFKDADAIASWLTTYNEHPIYSIFEKSKLSDEKLAVALEKAGLEKIEVIGLQLGGNVSETLKDAAKVNCSLKNIAGCREIISVAMKTATSQLPKDVNDDTLKAFRPTTVWKLKLKYQD